MMIPPGNRLSPALDRAVRDLGLRSVGADRCHVLDVPVYVVDADGQRPARSATAIRRDGGLVLLVERVEG